MGIDDRMTEPTTDNVNALSASIKGCTKHGKTLRTHISDNDDKESVNVFMSLEEARTFAIATLLLCEGAERSEYANEFLAAKVHIRGNDHSRLCVGLAKAPKPE
ncbi:hypothetical protein OAH18_01270 [bacterium]|nr:hypothetical protein [bacterium]